MNKETIICRYCGDLIYYEQTARSANGATIYLKSGKTVCLGRRCNNCKLKQQRHRRRSNKNYDTIKYEKTKRGFLMRCFRNMRSRVDGVQIKKFHLYSGKRIYFSRDEFYEWSMKSCDFNMLFSKWEKSGYDRRLTPSVDRINSKRGYSFENIQWVPFHVNCSRVSRS